MPTQTQKDAVLHRLRSQKAEGGVVDRTATLEEWNGAVADLLRTIEGWLSEASGEGLFTIGEEEVGMTEPRLGAYQLPARTLKTPNGETIRIVPKGRFVVGGRGRVDLECPPKKSILLRDESNRWQYAKLIPEAGGWVSQELTEDTFWQALGDLI